MPRYKFPAGTVVGAPVDVGGVEVVHVGLVTGALDWRTGDAMVISASKKHGRVVEEPMHDFSGGREVAAQGHLQSVVPPWEAIHRARSDLGQNWNLFGNNCEHFVRRWIGLPEVSPQLAVGIAATLTLAGGMAWMLKQSKRRRA